MFTGIVEEQGKVLALDESEKSWRLKVAAEEVLNGVAVGDSVAVNGCCLTVVEVGDGSLTFDLLEETRQVTNLGDAQTGYLVNLERSLRFDGRMGGHFVTGHVDAVGTVLTLEEDGKDRILRIETPKEFEQYLVYKGCIAIDGVSLTAHRVEGNIVTIWLIPHTLEVTSLDQRLVGSRVNLEFDIVAKYTESIIAKQER